MTVSDQESLDAGPLAGIVVVDLTHALAGPHAAMMLGDLGARVIKVENPEGGDEARAWGPPFVESARGGTHGTYFLSANRNKESLALDLKQDSDVSVVRDLVARADVLLENFRPGAMERFGISPASLLKLNPRLVIMSISGFGHDGPEGGRPGYDQIAQGEVGLMSVTGMSPDEPQRVGIPISDVLAGMYGAFGVLAALFERSRSGQGRLVRTSLLAAVVGAHAFQGTAWTVGRTVGRAQGNHHPAVAPYGLFRCADGAVQIACGTQAHWERLCVEFGIDPHAEGLQDNAARVTHRAMLIEVLEGSFATLGRDEVLARLKTIAVPSGLVRSMDEVYAWDQLQSQGLLVDVEHEALGPIQLPGPPLRFFSFDHETEVEETKVRHQAPPLLDADGGRIRDWLGRSPAVTHLMTDEHADVLD